MLQVSRKQWYELLNTKVLEVVGDQSEMLLAEVRGILHQDEDLNQVYKNMVRTHWKFTDFDDRFRNNVKNCQDVNIEKIGSRIYVVKK